MHRLEVALALPAHSALGGALSYCHSQSLPPGTLVRVPLGQREVLGVVRERDASTLPLTSDVPLRPIAEVLDGIAPLGHEWRALIAFAASYYQRAWGEMALAALPPQLRTLSAAQWTRAQARYTKQARAAIADAVTTDTPHPLEPEQAQALQAIEAQPATFLLFGATGSGKTEIYLQAAERQLARDAQAQVLVLVPEINLTPQLAQRFEARFGAQQVAVVHSGMTPAQRLHSWWRAHTGAARIVLGTRVAVLASMPHLALLVVDEEHDASYKQQEGARYSARDLAIWRAHTLGVPVVLGSATPSLESWHASRPPGTLSPQDEGGRYRRLSISARIGDALQPRVRLLDMRQQPRGCVLAPPLLDAIGQCVQRGEQALLLLNRRGYAPVLVCHECGWKSECTHCSAFLVFHKAERQLRCHHCGWVQRVPRACPACGNLDIFPQGMGTEQIEEYLQTAMQTLRPSAPPLRIARIDADTTRHKGGLQSQLGAVHAGDVDVLVGTQMIAKGHDFRRVSLVAAVQPDNALFSDDFRAAERLFALLLQAGGRAGRDAAFLRERGSKPQLWLQTFQPAHPLFGALARHDYPQFAAQQLRERMQAGLPPFMYQALLRADAREMPRALAFLHAAADAVAPLAEPLAVAVYGAVPMSMQRIARAERAQLLVECASRPALQALLTQWQPLLRALASERAHGGVLRWFLDVDPIAI